MNGPKVLFDVGNAYTFPDCDCACGVEYATSPSPSLSVSEPWVAVPPAYHRDLSVEETRWQVRYTPSAPVPITVLNEAAQQVWETFRSPRLPVWLDGGGTQLSRSLADMARTGLLRPWKEGATVTESRATTFTAWLYLTQACNLRCPYCYVPHRGRAMSEAIMRDAVRKLLDLAAAHDYRRLRLKYAGGEPTLNFAVLRAGHQYAVQRAAQVGVALDAVILTNGVMWDEEMLAFVADNHLRLGISLDGGEVAHNRLRVFPDGSGSFRYVRDTIDKAVARGIPVSLSITVTKWNLDGVAPAVQFAMERGLPFNLNFVRSWTPVPWQPDAESLLAAMKAAFSVMERHLAEYPRSLTHSMDRAWFDTPHTRPCSAGRDYVAVGVEGQISACQMKLDEPWSHITEADPLVVVRRKGESLFGSTVDELPDCATCPWQYACAGGCPLLRGTSLHADYCRVYRSLYPELVRLEGLRLLRQQVAS